LEKGIHPVCRKLLVEKLGRSESSQWLDVDYEKLREEIYSVTQTLISKNTLKRYFGKLSTGAEYDPQRETKNAFAIYLGFKDWQQFEQSQEVHAKDEFSVGNTGSKQEIGNRRGILFSLVLIAVCILAGIVWNRSLKSKVEIPDFTFRIENPVDTAPFSMISHYEVKDKNDSLFVKLRNQEKLAPGDSILTTMIPLPTFTWLSVGHKGKELRQFPVYAYSRGWEVVYSKTGTADFMPVPRRFSLSTKGLGVKKDWFSGKSLDSVNFNQDFLNFKNFDLDGDHFSSEFKVTITKPHDICKLITFRFFGYHKHIEFKIGPPFCSQHNFINLAELFYPGRRFNLNQIFIGYDKTTTIKLEVKNKEATLFIEGKSVFTGKFQTVVGAVKGVKVSCDGFATIHSFKAWNAKGQLVAHDQFDR